MTKFIFKLLLVSIILLTMSVSSIAQDTIRGRVTAFNTYGLNLVKVSTKGTKQTVYTDTLGHFSIACKAKDLLRIQAEGFDFYQEKTNGENNLKVNLIYINNSNAYTKVLSNHHMKQAALDYAIEHLIEENNDYSNFQSIFDLIQSICPTASINKSSSPIKIILSSRGPNSLFAGEEALLVVDKIVTDDISSLSPLQVTKIEVLVGNDAANYGVRGGNGVIEITLKH